MTKDRKIIYGVNKARGHLVHQLYSTEPAALSHCGRIKAGKLSIEDKTGIALHLSMHPGCMCRHCFPPRGFIPKEVRDLMTAEQLNMQRGDTEDTR